MRTYASETKTGHAYENGRQKDIDPEHSRAVFCVLWCGSLSELGDTCAAEGKGQKRFRGTKGFSDSCGLVNGGRRVLRARALILDSPKRRFLSPPLHHLIAIYPPLRSTASMETDTPTQRPPTMLLDSASIIPPLDLALSSRPLTLRFAFVQDVSKHNSRPATVPCTSGPRPRPATARTRASWCPVSPLRPSRRRQSLIRTVQAPRRRTASGLHARSPSGARTAGRPSHRATFRSR